jgi:hypothetical protein
MCLGSQIVKMVWVFFLSKQQNTWVITKWRCSSNAFLLVLLLAVIMVWRFSISLNQILYLSAIFGWHLKLYALKCPSDVDRSVDNHVLYWKLLDKWTRNILVQCFFDFNFFIMKILYIVLNMISVMGTN